MKKLKNAMYLILTLLIALTSIGAVAAEVIHSPLPPDYVQKQLSFFEKIKVARQPFAIVNGGQCAERPTSVYSFTGDTKPIIGQDICPIGTTGCRLCYYTNTYQFIGCTDAPPGQEYFLENTDPKTAFIESYSCTEQACTELSEFQNAGCGDKDETNTCKEGQMLRKQENSCGITTTTCTWQDECRTKSCTYSVGEWGPCIAGTQSREITHAGCANTRQTQACVVSPGTPVRTSDVILTASKELASIAHNDIVVSETTIKNEGTNMNVPWIIEMQVVKKGSTPFSFVSSSPEACDPNHLENSHLQFMLNSGEEETIKLRTLKQMEDGEYDVYLLTRTKCFNELSDSELQDLGDWRVEPYRTSKLIGSVCVGDGCYSVLGASDSEDVGFSGVQYVALFGIGLVVIAGIILVIRRVRK